MFPHSLRLLLALALTLAAVALIFSPMIIRQMEAQGWHSAAVITAWVGYIWMGFLFLFFCIGLVYHVQTGLTRLADGRLLYVNRGAGTWGPPLRLLEPPEITLITIESEKK